MQDRALKLASIVFYFSKVQCQAREKWRWHILLRSICARFLVVLVEALSDSLPVDDLPDGLEVVGADVLVLEVVGVLPDINAQQGDQTGGGLERVLVGGGSDLKALEVLVVALLE